MITTIAEYKLMLESKRLLENSGADDAEAFRKVLKEHPELSVLPVNLCPGGKPITKIYRTVRQTDLFDDIYGTHGTQASLTGTYLRGKMPPLPKTKPMVLKNSEHDTNEPGWESTTDWTIDPGYYYQVHDEVIRLCLDFNKVKALVGNENILNLLHDGEAEIRLRNDLPLMQLLDSIEILEEAFEDETEDEFGENRAIKDWLPKDLMPFVKLVDEMEFRTPQYCKNLDAYYNKVYAPYGVVPIKPYGNTWID